MDKTVVDQVYQFTNGDGFQVEAAFYRRKLELEPEEKLMEALLFGAMQEYHNPKAKPGAWDKAGQNQRAAHAWIITDSDDVFGFNGVCEALNISPTAARKAILDKIHFDVTAVCSTRRRRGGVDGREGISTDRQYGTRGRGRPKKAGEGQAEQIRAGRGETGSREDGGLSALEGPASAGHLHRAGAGEIRGEEKAQA